MFTEYGIVIPAQGEVAGEKAEVRAMLEQNNELYNKYTFIEYKQDYKEIQTVREDAREEGT